MTAFKIGIDLSHLMQRGSAFTKEVFPHLAAAVQAITDRCESRWKLYASGVPMPNGKSVNPRSGQYLRSIMQRSKGDFSTEVYSELPYAKTIEEGAPRRDMKTLLASSLKVRMSTAGRRYLIIPFRHSPNANNVMRDNAMPAAVHEWWADKAASAVVGMMLRPTGTGAYDIRSRQVLLLKYGERAYKWGSRLSAETLAELGANERQARRMQGMVQFRKPGAKGGAAHTQYITFRTMTENSKGWVVPPQPGKWPARQTADLYRPVAERMFAAAVEQDIRSVLPGA